MEKTISKILHLLGHFELMADKAKDNKNKWLDTSTTYGDTPFPASAVYQGQQEAFEMAASELSGLCTQLQKEKADKPNKTGAVLIQLFDFMEKNDCKAQVFAYIKHNSKLDLLQIVDLIKDQPQLFILSIGPWHGTEEAYWIDLNVKCFEYFDK
jgi:hypothetical protein